MSCLRALDGNPIAPALSPGRVKHGMAQQPICFGLIAASTCFKPIDDVGIQAYGDGFLNRPIELANFGARPVENWPNIGKINVFASFGCHGFDVSFLLLCELPHKPSFHGIQRRAPK